jgi:hypothetical protein
VGIKSVLPERFGINLDDSYNYGNNQLTANLLASDGASFTPQIWQGSSQCSYSGTNTWVDANGYSPQIGNFWYGASYQVISGPNAGATGYITDSRPATGAQGQTFTLSGTLSQPCVGGGNSDEMILRCRTPLGTCATGYNPSALAGINLTTQGGGTTAFETTDISPSSNSPQGMLLTAPGTAQAGVQAIYEGLLNYHSYINLNGTYTLTFRAKATAGAPTLFYYVYRTGGTQFLTGSVTPTVNATPGAGWTNYSFTFTANEDGGQVEDGSVWIDAQGGSVLLQDLALTEAPAGGNPTVFRNAVYQKLLALHPGILRMMTGDSWGCTPDNMMAVTYSARYLCGNSSYQQYGQPISYGWSDFLTLAQAVGADPWITFSVYSTPADMANIAAYLGGTCGNGNPYTALRCNYGQTTPWTQVFNHIYLEMGNEIWNSPNGEDVYGNGGQNYGTLLGANVAALKASSFYASNIKMVASGFVLQSDFAYGWNWTVLTAAGNHLPDYIDGAPYMFQDMTDLSSTQNIFGPMFAEPVNYTMPSGATYGLQQYTQSNFPGVNGAIYETNLTTNCALTGTTQTQINQVVAGVGAGLDATLTMLLGVRDAGVLVQNFFALPEVENSFGLAASANSGSCPQTYSPYEPLWGANLFMPGPTNASAIDRPSGIALQLINNAIGSNLNLLNVAQTGTPTYNQPAAQPNPTSWPTAGQESIAANAAVPYVQSFGFGDGAGDYTLIVYNLNLNASEAITFSGAAAPTGTVTKTVFTSNNITDNNEGLKIGATPVVAIPSATTLSSPAGDTLPAFSMTTYTWTAGGASSPTIVVSSSLSPAAFGQPVTLTASLTGVSGAPTGSVTFYNGTTELGTATLSVTGSLTSTATFTTSGLPGGTDSITASNGGGTSPAFSQVVTADTSTAAVTSSMSSTIYGQATTLTATVTGNYAAPTGSVTFMDGTTSIATASLTPGSGLSSTASLTTSTLPVGTDSITASYAATASFGAATSPALSQVVSASSTTAAVASSLNPSSYGQSIGLTATLTGTYAAPTGSVTFMSGTTSIGTATLTPSGSLTSTATLNTSALAQGTDSITAVYAATADFGASTSSAISQVVTAASTTATVASSLNPSNTGQSVTFTGTITNPNGAPTGTVTFMNGTTSIGTATLAPGSGLSSTATLATSTLPVGSDSITVVYAGSGSFPGATSSAISQVVNTAGSTATVASSLNPSTQGQSVTFLGTISSPSGAPTGTVTFMNGSTSIGTATLVPGSGQSSTATLATSALPVGSDPITVVYAGSGSFGAATSSAMSQVVNSTGTSATVATVSSPVSPVSFGQSVTFNATVTSTSTAPTGSVTFMNGATAIGTATLNPGIGLSSTAALSTSTLPVGSNPITVVYAGTASFGASTSAAFSEVINPAVVTVAVASSLSPSGYGQSVTLTATVSSNFTAPTGSVTFWNGATQIGSGTLTAGSGPNSTATLNITTLPVGTDTITAAYVATVNFGPANSPAISQVVTGSSTTASIASSLNPSSYGQPVTLTATVSSGSAAPAGSVTFMKGATAIGSANLTPGSGLSSTATLSTTTLTAGTDSITAVYAGTANFGGATSAALSQVVNSDSTSATIASSLSPSSAGESVTFTATVSSGYAAPTGSVTFMNGSTTIGSGTLAPGSGLSSTAVLTIASLPVGTQSITAVYAATTNFGGSTSAAFSQVVNTATSTTATVLSSSNPAGVGQPVTLTATLVGLFAPPTGSVTFMDGATTIGSGTLAATGSLTSTATLTTAALPLGTDPITAVYAGTVNFGAATSAVLSQVVTTDGTTATVTSSLNPATVGQSVTLTATISSGSAAPTGSVTFMDGATTIGSGTLAASGSLSSIATLTTSSLPLGTDAITVVYAGTQTFGAATSAALSEVVGSAAGTTATVSASPSPSSLGQQVTLTATLTGSAAPTGSVVFTDGGTTIGSATLAASGSLSSIATLITSALPLGNDSITATYVPTGGFTATSASTTQVVDALSAATTLTASPNPANAGQTITLTATVSGSSTTPSGSVSFYSGSILLGSVALNGSASATYTTASLAAGTDTLTAVYSGNSIYAGSTSAAVSETIQATSQNFTMALAIPNLTVQSENSATNTVTLSSENGFADTVNLSCANLPTYITCSLNPATTTLVANGSSTTSLTIGTGALAAVPNGSGPLHPADPPFNLALTLSPIGFLVGIAAFPTRRSRRRPLLRLLILLVAAIPMTLAFSGCASPGNTPEVTSTSAPAGTYTIPITAIGATSGTSHTVQLTLVVTQ